MRHKLYSRSFVFVIAALSFVNLSGCQDDTDEPSIEASTEPGTEPDTEIPVVHALETPTLALTPTELNNTVRDLLGMPMNGGDWPDPPAIAEKLAPSKGERSGVFGLKVPAIPTWPWIFPAENGVEGFEGMTAGQEPSAYGVEELQKATIHFASFVLISPVFFNCDDWASLQGEEQNTCSWTSIERFAQRAWRRPLETGEQERLEAFWASNRANGTAEEAVVLTAAGILLAPPFLYRLEVREAAQEGSESVLLNDWEMATRLSYFLWDSMPDPELFAAAASGQLSTPEQIETQTRRMLSDPKARAAVVRFHEQWLGTTRVHTVSPARRVYGPLFGIAPVPPLDTTGDGDWPAVLLPIRHSMAAETRLFIEQTIFDTSGTLHGLLTDNHGYLSEHTSAIYGSEAKILDGPTVDVDFGLIVNSGGQGSKLTLQPAEFPADQRAGVLTLPAVLAVGSYPVHPAPILRGKMILERLACQDFGTPPPNTGAAAPPDVEDAESTNRQRTEAATATQPCTGCHDNLNPPGFAFEHYDSLGRYRTEDNGQPVDASGSLALWSGETLTFKDGVDLAQQLATSERVQDCYVMRWARYATGIQLEEGDEALLPLQEAFRLNDRIDELLVQIAKSDMFRYRQVGGER